MKKINTVIYRDIHFWSYRPALLPVVSRFSMTFETLQLVLLFLSICCNEIANAQELIVTKEREKSLFFTLQ